MSTVTHLPNVVSSQTDHHHDADGRSRRKRMTKLPCPSARRLAASLRPATGLLAGVFHDRTRRRDSAGGTLRFNTLLRLCRFSMRLWRTPETDQALCLSACLAGQSCARRAGERRGPWRLRAAAIMLWTLPICLLDAMIGLQGIEGRRWKVEVPRASWGGTRAASPGSSPG